MLLILFFFLVGGWLLPVAAAPLPHPYYHFKQISIQQGLPSSVKTLCQDRRGSLWIGTAFGVYRMRGEQLQKYRLPHALRKSTRYVDRICRDVHNRVWMVHAQGLCYYDVGADSLQVLTRRGKPVQAKVVMHHGNHLVIPQGDSLYVYDDRLQLYRSVPMSQPTNLIQGIPFDSDRYLVLDHYRRLWLLDLQTGQLSASPFSGERNVFHTFRDLRGRFWISSYGQGVKCFSMDGKELQSYTTQNSNLTHDVVMDIAEWNGAIWLATDGGGVQLIYPDEQEVYPLSMSHSPVSLSSSVTSLFPMDDHLWVGTVRDGVLGVEKGFITTYTRDVQRPFVGLSDKSPLCLWQDAEGMIWIGTDGGGINRFHPQTETFTHYPETEGEKIVSICPYSSTELLVSSYNRGIFLFHIPTGRCRPWGTDFPELPYLFQRTSAPVNIRSLPNGDIELYGSVFYRYHRQEHRLERIHPGLPGVLASWIYLGTYRENPVFFDRRTVFAYHKDTNQYRSLSNRPSGQLLAAALDPKGYLWTAEADGVWMNSLVTGHRERIPLGHPEPEVTSLVVDHDGVVWMGALGGVYAYQPAQHHLAIYNEMDGVLPNDFLPKAVLATADGHVYMGGSEGLVHVNKPLKQAVPSSTLRLCLQEIYLDGKFFSFRSGESVVLPPDFASLEVHTFVEGGNTLHKRMYRFRVKGFHSGYVETSRPIYSLLTLPPGQYTLTAQCLQKEGSWSREFPLLTFTVSPPWWLEGSFLLFCTLLLIVLVIYAARLYDQWVQHRYAEQERVTYKEKVQTMVNINHELRTPLTLIYTPLKQLANSKQIPFEQRTKLFGVLKQAHQMKNIMDMILNLSKMEEKEDILRMRVADLNQWLQSVLEGFKEEFAVRGMQIVLQADERIGKMYFDLNQCEIILNNLLSNAYKFSDEHSVVTVTTKWDEAGGHVRISVSDEGMGLKQEDINRLFERFYQGKHGLQGIGIGLAYSKQLVEMHGGVIGARNNADKGATFFFTLPYRQEEAHIETAPKAYLNGWEGEWQKPLPIPEKSGSLAHPLLTVEKFHSVLLVEDDPDLCNYLTCNLQALFEHVYEAHDGLEALPLLTTHWPQLVLSDIRMSRMDGFELCRYIKKKPELNYIPVVLLTSFVDDSVREEAYKLGAEAFVTKPFDMDLLLVQLQNILHNQLIVKKHYAPLTPRVQVAEEQDYLSSQLLAQFNRIVRENLANPEMDVTFIAHQMGMSRAGLYSKLKGVLEVGISEYITQCRLEQAAVWLKTTPLSVADVAEKVGFKHSRNFSTLFKNMMGVSPSEYRKQAKFSEDGFSMK